jgi:hypothetical protein
MEVLKVPDCNTISIGSHLQIMGTSTNLFSIIHLTYLFRRIP